MSIQPEKKSIVRFLPVGLITHFVEKAARPR